MKKGLAVYCFDKKTKLIKFKVFNVSYDSFLFYKKRFADKNTSVVYRKF